MDLFLWSGTEQVTLGDNGGNDAEFNAIPVEITETGDNTGIFQTVFNFATILNGNPTPATESVTLAFTDWGAAIGAHVGDQSTDVTLSIANFANSPPVAVDDTIQVVTDSVANVLDVLANDTDPDAGDTKQIISFTPPDNGGSVTIINGGDNLEYTPAASFVGVETFTYTMQDGAGEQSTATVTMAVGPAGSNIWIGGATGSRVGRA